MADGDVWFGNAGLYQLLPAPERISRARAGYLERAGFESGGGAVARSRGYQQEFEFTYPWGDAFGQASIDAYADYASGEYGLERCYFANPMAFDTNLFPRHWASPGVIEPNFPVGWPNIGPGVPSWANTAANSYQQPSRKGTWTITTAANATPLTDTTIPYVIIPIPPTHTLWLGATGAATGTAGVRVESWVNGATSAASIASLTMQAETGSTRLASSIVGSVYAYVKVFLSRTSSAASTITPISLMAQLWPVAVSPTLTGSHVRGQGHTGLEFSDGAPVEEWTDASSGRHYKSMSVRLIETGAWA